MSFLTRNWRILLLSIFLISAFVAIRPHFGTSGALVSFVSTTSPTEGIIHVGDIIKTINGETITNADQVLKYYDKNVIVNGNNISNFTGIDVKNIPTNNIKLGLELVGGARVVLQPEEKIDAKTAQDIVETLRTRVNAFGLKDFTSQTIKSGDTYFIQVEMAGGTKEEIKELLEKQGKLQGKLLIKVPLTNGSGKLKLDSEHTISATENSLTLDGNTIEVNKTNSTTLIEGIKFEYGGIINGNAFLNAVVFSGTDLEISKDTTRSYVQGNTFYITLNVKNDGPQKFAKLTRNMPVITGSGEASLDTQLSFYLDDKLISSFNVNANLKGKEVSTPVIQGTKTSQDEAVQEKRSIESVLRSGALPVKLSIAKADTISPSLGNEFIKSTLIAGAVALIAVFAVILFRYRNWKISALMMLTNTSEIIIMLGFAAFISSTIDLPAIAGIIAVVGTGVNQLIIITDESRSNEQISLKAKIKRGLFVIFGSAATVLSAMFPLLIIGLGSIKSFALMTIAGVLVGVLITRPAYAQLYEHLIEKSQN